MQRFVQWLVAHFNMALKGSRRRATTSLYLIESRDAERKLAEGAREKERCCHETREAPLKIPLKFLQRNVLVADVFMSPD